MKRVISMILICAALTGLLAGCGKKQDETTVPESSTNPSSSTQAKGPASALEALENIWGQIVEGNKFWVVGGDYNNSVDNAPGAVSLTATDYLTASLLVPETQLSAISEAASMIHAMNSNTFTCGVYKVSDVSGFAGAMKEAILGNQWICGFPEKLNITDLGGGYVLVAFGVSEAMDPFIERVTQAYPDAVELANQPIA